MHNIVAPLVQRYFKEIVNPAWEHIQEPMGQWMASKFYEGDPRGVAVRQAWTELSREMDLAESKVTFAFSGIGERATATDAARKAITKLTNLLRNSTGTESLRHYLGSLDHRLSYGAQTRTITGQA